MRYHEMLITESYKKLKIKNNTVTVDVGGSLQNWNNFEYGLQNVGLPYSKDVGTLTNMRFIINVTDMNLDQRVKLETMFWRYDTYQP